MRLYLATSNQGKVKEIKALFKHHEVIPYSDAIPAFEIEEHGTTFAENAVIKAQAVFAALHDPEALVVADDSGISIDALEGAPGIYSARFAGLNATDKENLEKVVHALGEKGVVASKAHYTAAIALTSKYGTQVVHGWMHGTVVTTPKGNGGFGYDPIFIPEGHMQTLGELPHEIKAQFSHRSMALRHLDVLFKGMRFD